MEIAFKIRPWVCVAIFNILTAAAFAQTVTLSPTSLSFGNVVQGTSSVVKTLTLKNGQTTAVTISSVSTNLPDYTQTNNCPVSPSTLKAGKNCTISVTFTPSVLGSRTATLTVNHTGANSPQTASLSGTGVVAVTASPASLLFANQVIGVKSSVQKVTVTNNQKTALTITSIVPTPADYSTTTTCPVGTGTLAAGASCSVSVFFTPAAAGARNGTLTISDNAAVSPTVALTGTGVLAAVVTPSSLNFGNQALGTTSAAQVVTFTNNQTSGLKITSISTGSNDFPLSSTCPISPSTLAAGASCTASVSFTPKASNARTATLTFTDKASNSPQTVALSGTGTAATLVSVAVTPANASVVAGKTQQYTATGTYTDNSTQDLTGTVSWTSSKTAVATVAAGGIATGIASGSASITATSGSISGSTTLTVLPPALVSIAITPSNPSLVKGTTQALKATGTFTDGNSQDLTTSVTWNAANSSVATVSVQGVASAASVGSTNVTATSGTIAGTTTVTVTPPALVSIAVTPATPTIPLGTTHRFTATGTFTDGSTQDLTSTVQWNSDTPSTATISNSDGSQGLATSVSTGTASISAASSAITGSTSLSVTPPTLVSISVTPSASSIALGTTLQFTATGTFTDGSTQDLTSSVAWSSSAPDDVTLSTSGLATGTGIGTATIAATLNEVSNSTTVTVGQAALLSIAITPSAPSFALGTMQTLKATGTYTDGSTQDLTTTVSWSTVDSTVATVSPGGVASSVAVGNTNVSAINGSVQGTAVLTVTPAELVSIAVTPAIPSIASGTTLQLTATGTFTDGTTQDLTHSVEWTSDTPDVATINGSGDQIGLANGLSMGSATITATSGTVNGSTTLTVTPATLVSIAVAPLTPSIPLGTTQQFTATGTFTDGSSRDLTSTVSWTVDDPSMASISSAGLATSLGQGSTNVSATSGDVVGSSTLIVTTAELVSLDVSPPVASVPLGVTQQFTATGTFSDSTTQDLTQTVHWSSTAAAVATISDAPGTQGLATSLGVGNTTIQATSGSVEASASLTVNAAALVSISIAPLTPSVPLGTSQQFTATGTYSDGTTQDITSVVVWSSSSANVLVISNDIGSNGFATSSGLGTATVTATAGSISSSTVVSVGDAVLTSITIAPTDSSIAQGYTLQFSATGMYSDGTAQDVTQSVAWSSSTTSVASLNSGGLATAILTGTTTISAVSGSVSSSTTLTVSSPVPISVSVTPLGPSVYIGGQQQFSATLTYSDGSLFDVTSTVTWTSSASGVATINAAGSASGVSVGGSTISATWGGYLTTSTTLNVMLPIVTVTPASAAVAVSGTQQFTANITGLSNQSVTWAVDGIPGGNTSVGTISTGGLYTAPVMIGSHSITATAQANSASIGTAYITVGSLVPLDGTFFGMHLHYATSPVPSTMDAAGRIWDSNAAQWPNLNTGSGKFVWGALDAVLASYKTAGINDVIYTLWRVPKWASSNPTDATCDYANLGANYTGECDLPTDLNPDGTGSDFIWRDWVQNIAQHVNDPGYLQTHVKISYWEACNECYRSPKLDPGYGTGGAAAAYKGTYNQLIRMMQDARCIIIGNPDDPITALGTTCGQAGYPVIGIDPQAKMVMPSANPIQNGKNNPPYPQVMQNILYCTCAGNSCSASPGDCTTGSAGSKAIDLVSVHIYPNSTAYTPEAIPGQMAYLKTFLQPQDLAKPFWSDEGGWGKNAAAAQIGNGDPDLEAAWIARFHIMVWASGVQRVYWYEWDNAAYGTLWSPTTMPNGVSDCTAPFTAGYLCTAGTAYQQVHNWLVGSTLTNCSAAGTVWTCNLTQANGSAAQILWDTSQTCSSGSCGTIQRSVSANFNTYMDLAGLSHSISGSVPVGLKPILVLTQ